MRRPAYPIALLMALSLGACASSTSSEGNPGGPAPKPIDPDAPPATEEGTGPAVTYRPVNRAAYRLERRDSLVFQYEGASQVQTRNRVAQVHLTIAEAASRGTYRVTVILDSLEALESGSPVPPDSVTAALGATWTGTLSSVGTLSELKPDREGTLTAELAGHLRLLFPALPEGGVREGMQWTDSASYPLVSDAFTGNEQAVTVYRASDTEEVSGREAIPLETSSKYSRSGKRIQGEQELEMTATGTRSGVHRLSVAGVLVSAEGSDTGEMTISVPAVGQTVPVTRSSTYAVSSLASGP
jgi:hypothetical protein